MIQLIHLPELPELTDLFIECFIDDHYYIEHLSMDREEREQIMRTQFVSILSYSVANNNAYGYYIHNKLCGFIIVFNYRQLKHEDPNIFHSIFSLYTAPFTSLPYSEKLHASIEQLTGGIIYILSIGVSVIHRKSGIGSSLIDYIIKNNITSNIVSDISNKESLSIYKYREFNITIIDKEYYLVIKKPLIDISSIFCDDAQIPLLLPEKVQDIINSENLVYTKVAIDGYKIEGSDYKYFIKKYDENCFGYLVYVDYNQLLSYQRYANLCDTIEDAYILNKGHIACIYYRKIKYGTRPLINDTLKELLKSRSAEWFVIPDIQVLIPIEYNSNSKFCASREYDEYINTFLRSLDYRTYYEVGVSKDHTKETEFDFHERIERFYIGKCIVQIREENSIDTYNHLGAPIGQPASVYAIISIDKNSNCGVLSLISESTPFLLSHFLDAIIRNQLYIYNNGVWENLIMYFQNEYLIYKRGTAKMFLTIPQKKDCLQPAQVASLLMAETIYDKDQSLGNFSDKDILKIINSETGIGQYDRAFVCGYTNTLIQFYDQLHCSVISRLQEEAITFFYIELLAFEEAAINIAQKQIVLSLTNVNKIGTKNFLRTAMHIHKRYAQTIEFWDVQVLYPSSRKSISAIRTAFKLDEQLNRMYRYDQELQTIFGLKRDILDRTEASILNYILLFLTLIESLSIVFPYLFENEGAEHGEFVGLSVIILIIIFIVIIKKIVNNYQNRYKL